LKNKTYTQIIKTIEAASVLILFAAHIHFLTSYSAGLQKIVFAALIIIAASIFSLSPLAKRDADRRHLWLVLFALAGGFWIFNVFRYAGYLIWPIGHPDNLRQYLRLLYSHFVLSLMVLSFVLFTAYLIRTDIAVKWGSFKRLFNHHIGTILLTLAALGTWSWSLFVIITYRPQFENLFILLIPICLAKAALTGITEEICYRGVVQPIAVRHFGLPLGIVLQSGLYTAFHMHLGPAIVSRGLFLPAVFVLGIIFGVVSYRTKGIGWAILMHTALNVGIEWRNLC